MNLPAHAEASPFDSIRHIDDEGVENWSARDLMAHFGYARWTEVRDGIARARVAIANTMGEAAGQNHIEAGLKMVALGSGARREIPDFRLTRYGAYMWAMNGDPRKPEIAAAQTYFAVKTREAETPPVAPAVADLSSPAGVLALAEQYVDTARTLVAQTERVKELEPKAAAHDAYLAAHDSDRLVRETAKLLGVRESWLRGFLVDDGLIFPRYAPCGTRFYDAYAQYRAHFRPTETVISHNSTGPCAHYTLRVTPRGVELIRQRLIRAGHLTTAARAEAVAPSGATCSATSRRRSPAVGRPGECSAAPSRPRPKR
ncbi:phage antirepressor KilAC domain-containing protein [Streptomyces sp. NPDC059008]|uniref:phage antirepressor KilAC domain-containing protein n=1 Tax=Streptomyces sp. NPDC059008 TaxID=3346693 RepID=UPI0036CD0324